MNTWLPQVSYPCGNFSDTSCLKLSISNGSISPILAVCIHTENQDQPSICPFALNEVSVLVELALGHVHYFLTYVPPQSNSKPECPRRGSCLRLPTRVGAAIAAESKPCVRVRMTLCNRSENLNPRSEGRFYSPFHRVSKEMKKVVVFHWRHPQVSISHFCCTSHVSSQSQTRVKLNRVFFPHQFCQACSLVCGFARE